MGVPTAKLQARSLRVNKLQVYEHDLSVEPVGGGMRGTGLRWVHTVTSKHQNRQDGGRIDRRREQGRRSHAPENHSKAGTIENEYICAR